MDVGTFIKGYCLYNTIARNLFALFGYLLTIGSVSVVFFPSIVNAQVTQYTNSTDGPVNETATPCTAAGYLVRNFSVPTSYTISDVNIGIMMAHTYRGDLLMYLSSPTGTRIQLFTGTGGGANNFNILLDSALGTSVTSHSSADTASAATIVPPFQRNFSPANSLNPFNGENSFGTWTLEICDRYNADAGNFYQADLFLAQTPTNYADLSLSKSVSNTSPANGTAISYTLQVTNASSSPNTATGVVVNDLLPLGVTYTSSSGYGSYDNVSGNWTISSIAPGQTRTLTINATVAATSGATVVNSAEVTASSQLDLDSTVNNGSTSEDDDDTASFTVTGTRVAGTPPSLSAICPPANQILFDWDSLSWTAGSTSNSYTIAGIGTVGVNIGLTSGTWVSDASFGGLSPTLTNANNGGFAGSQVSLHQYIDFTNISGEATTVISLPTAVPGAQFTVFDIDYAAADFADKLTVTGTYNGGTVIPTLTNGIANYVVGNVAIGDAGSGGTSGNGNVIVTFTSPVDTITVKYGNHTTAPSDPDGQAAAIFDINLCKPQATLSVTKVSSVLSDPVNGTTNPKAIPGALMQYCILISNAGSGTVTSVAATDTLPGNVTFQSGTMRSGSNCVSAATVEDDNNSGADESDPFGAAISGSLLSAMAASLAPSTGYALTFQVTVN